MRKLFVINTGNLMLDGGAMFGVVPKSIWSKLVPPDENNLVNLTMRCLLVADKNRNILIDTGIGNKQPEKFLSHYNLNGDDTLEKSLAQAGFSPDDITDVFHTHLHFDHCGGSIALNSQTNALEPVFRNADHWVSRAQWEWAIHSNPREKTSFLKENIFPMQESGRLCFIENDCTLFDGFDVKLYHGHTQGQAIPFIDYKGTKVVFTSDLIPSVANLPIAWIPSYDTQPLVSMKEKQAFLQEALDNKYVLFFEHDLQHQCCTLKQTEKGMREKEVFALEKM